MPKPRRAVLALGGNLGDRQATLESALESLRGQDGILVKVVSPFVESVALTEAGLDSTLPSYLNAVVLIETTLKPKKLLAAIHQIESDHGRVRIERWGSRTLDIDIVTFEGVIKSSKKLTLPHPRASERAFVLVPWLMADPVAVLPGYGSVAILVDGLTEEVRVVS
jgi:2-amino-4-hydroxy-6-hydroxymethyldihydropteridine diphosphokinase